METKTPPTAHAAARLRLKLNPSVALRRQLPFQGSLLVTTRRCVLIVLLLPERGRCLYRSLSSDCFFRAHFNLWWARHGWPLIHLVARQDSRFSRPPYLTAAVNLTAEQPSEPPRGGEHGAGENCLNRKRPFAESRNGSDYRMRPAPTA